MRSSDIYVHQFRSRQNIQGVNYDVLNRFNKFQFVQFRIQILNMTTGISLCFYIYSIIESGFNTLIFVTINGLYGWISSPIHWNVSKTIPSRNEAAAKSKSTLVNISQLQLVYLGRFHLRSRFISTWETDCQFHMFCICRRKSMTLQTYWTCPPFSFQGMHHDHLLKSFLIFVAHGYYLAFVWIGEFHGGLECFQNLPDSRLHYINAQLSICSFWTLSICSLWQIVFDSFSSGSNFNILETAQECCVAKECLRLGMCGTYLSIYLSNHIRHSMPFAISMDVCLFFPIHEICQS